MPCKPIKNHKPIKQSTSSPINVAAKPVTYHSSTERKRKALLEEKFKLNSLVEMWDDEEGHWIQILARQKAKKTLKDKYKNMRW